MIIDKTRKAAAVDFLRSVAAGSVREAYRRHIAPGFRHHNPYFHGDAQSLMAAMEENAANHPDKQLEIQCALEEGDRVVIFSRMTTAPGDRGAALVHIFRFEDELIAELWDIGQPVPENSPNEYGMF